MFALWILGGEFLARLATVCGHWVVHLLSPSLLFECAQLKLSGPNWSWLVGVDTVPSRRYLPSFKHFPPSGWIVLYTLFRPPPPHLVQRLSPSGWALLHPLVECFLILPFSYLQGIGTCAVKLWIHIWSTQHLASQNCRKNTATVHEF